MQLGFPFDVEIELADLNSYLYILVVFTFNCITIALKQGLLTNQDLLNVEPFTENV